MSKNTLILVAMDKELEDCFKKYTFEKIRLTSLSIEAYLHSFGDKNIYLVKTGVGPINASAVTALLLNELKVNQVILLGLGGAVDRRLSIGDICIGTSIIQHDAICSYDDRTEQMACGELHLSLDPKERPSIKISTDNDFNEKIGLYLKNKGSNLFTGDILSGSEFNASITRKGIMKEKFKNAVLVEMEACAVGYICQKFKVPFTVIKTVADTLNQAPDKEYKDYLISSSEKCADVFEFVRGL